MIFWITSLGLFHSTPIRPLSLFLGACEGILCYNIVYVSTHPKKEKYKKKVPDQYPKAEERKILNLHSDSPRSRALSASLRQHRWQLFPTTPSLINHSSVSAYRERINRLFAYILDRFARRKDDMTESQLPAAAAAQKFGTLIPNRIFGEWLDGTGSFFFRSSNCIMSLPFANLHQSDAAALATYIITVQLAE